MMNNWKDRLLNNWGIMRFLRLGLAILVLIEAWKNSEIVFGLLGGILLFQALANVGCCGSAGCDINQSYAREKSATKEIKDVTFEEINKQD